MTMAGTVAPERLFPMQSEYVTHAELDVALARIETAIANLRTDVEKTAHAQTRQMFNLLLPVYGGIVVGLLVFIASKVL